MSGPQSALIAAKMKSVASCLRAYSRHPHRDIADDFQFAADVLEALSASPVALAALGSTKLEPIQ